MFYRILDNGGQTFDRYTIMFNDDFVSCYSISFNPFHPFQGACFYFSLKERDANITFYNYDYTHFGSIRMDEDALPDGVVRFIESKLAEYKTK